MEKQITLTVEGTFPKGIKPTEIKVEPDKGTYGLYAGEDCLGYGQFPKR